jgi:hypothetical protein
MKHPFERLSPGTQRTAYWVALGATALLAFVLQAQVAEVIPATAGQVLPYNIIDFELARTPEKAQEIVNSWGPEGCQALFTQIVTDYLFLLAYPQAIALGILAVLMNTRNARLLAFGRALAWLQWVAGALDAIENAALLGILKGHVASPLPEISYWCATPKFAIVIAGVLFVIIFAGLGYTRDSASSDSASRS